MLFGIFIGPWQILLVITRAFIYVYFRNLLFLEGGRTEVSSEMEDVIKLLQIFMAYRCAYEFLGNLNFFRLWFSTAGMNG